MEENKLTCIGCPKGCQITVTLDRGAVIKVSGNTCQIGDHYARQEITAPVRTVTSTVKVTGGVLPVVPVKTRTEIPKERVVDAVRALRELVLEAPVEIGQVVLTDVCGTGVDMVATRDVEREGKR